MCKPLERNKQKKNTKTVEQKQFQMKYYYLFQKPEAQQMLK